MKKYFLLFSLISSLFTSSVAFGQAKKPFSTDPVEFIQDLTTFYNDDKRDESIQTIKAFEDIWKKTPFTSTEQAQIIDFANAMQKAKLRIFPDYNAWLNTLIAYKNGKVTEDRLTKYHTTGKLVIDKAKKDFKDYSVCVGLLFSDLAFAKNEAKKWSVSNADYNFEFADNKVSVVFPKLELMLLTREDTMGIYETSGRYYPADEKWVGKGGMVYWTRVGFTRPTVSAKLKNYTLNTKVAEYRADSVELNYPSKFGKAVLGRLEDKATTDYLGPKATYPRFQSYQAIFELKNLFKNIDYKGGFGLQGQQILGTGTDTTKAMLTIHYNNKVALRAYSKAFVIAPDKISSEKAAVAVYLDKDSVYHSQLIFTYVERDRQLTLSRDDQGMYAAPFFDSYHQMEYRVGNMIWRIDEPLISLKTNANPDQAAEFQSGAMYSLGNYMRMQTILDYNPLAKLTKYVNDNKTRVITMDELAAYMNNKPAYLQNLLFTLANEGFIFYDIDAQKIYVKDKLPHYYYSAEKNEDYDIIKFESVISAHPNATLSLLSQDLKIEGVRGINLSDTQSTFIIPADQTVTVKKNRDMTFSGYVHSGRFDFWGNDFFFNYNRFTVNFNNIDSVKFKFPEYKDGKMIGMRTIQNTIQNVSGTLSIDGPNNKSGKIKMEDYPIFECTKQSYVYYDRKFIYNGVYDRNRFYYTVDPFTIKRLDDFTAEGLQFPGALTSADILPVIKNALTIQEDFSLGFKQDAPPAGYPLYKGKGTGHGKYLLSNHGLHGVGEVDYLPSKTTSQDFVFFPDSMNSHSDQFVLSPNTTYPSLSGKGTYNHWMPYQDSMFIYKGKDPIAVYNNKIDFSGSFILTPKELVGTGAMTYQNLDIASKSFAFLPNNIQTKNGEVGINGVAGQRKALAAKDMTIDLDLTKDFGKFSANKDTSQIQLPQNRYSTTLNNFTYDIGKKEVVFVKNDKASDDNTYFQSTNPEQLALKFNSKKATLDLNKSEILAQDVPYLGIGDSRIFTANKEVLVEKEGNLGSIKGAEIVTDVDLQYHKVYNAYVNVFSKNKYTAYGNYDYIDRNNKKFVLNLNDVRTDENGKTTGKGVITDTANFYLSPGLKYSGNVGFTARKKDLGFDGYVLAENANPALKTEYVKIADTIDPKNVVLNISNPVAKDGKELFTGTFMTGTDKPKLYNMLFGRKNDYADEAIFSVTGALYYDDKLGEFRVGPKEKVGPAPDGGTGDFVEGNLFRYSPSKNQVNTEGVYNFGADLKHVELATAGNYYYKYADTSHQFNLVMTINFPLSDEAGKIMTDTILENSYNNVDVENNKPSILNAFSMIMKDKKQKDKVLAGISTDGFVPITDELTKTFTLTEVKMSFSDTSKTFISSGELGMANALKVPVNKRMNGIIEITRKRSGDKFAILIESGPGSYHYFQYAGGYLSNLSSDYTFTDKVTETAEKVEKGKGNFKFKPATVREIKMLKRKQRK